MFIQYYSSSAKFLSTLTFSSQMFLKQFPHMSRGSSQSADLMITRGGTFIYHEENSNGGPCSVSLASCEEGSLISSCPLGEPMMFFAESRALLCSSKMSFSNWPRGLCSPYRFVVSSYSRDASLEVCYIPSETCLLPSKVCSLPCVCCLSHHSSDFPSCSL